MNTPREELPEVYAEVLEDPGREALLGARDVIAIAPDDDPDDVQRLADLGAERVTLERRGLHHGAWAELDLDDSGERLLPRPSQLRQRWRRAEPWVWRQAVLDDLRTDRNLIHAGLSAYETLIDPAGLEPFLRARLGGRGARFDVLASRESLADPDRDLACVGIRDSQSGIADLWSKTGRLSTHPEDGSIRMRFSFGDEGSDDASADTARHRAVTALTEAVLPEARLADRRGELLRTVSEWHGEPLFATQGIAYWNTPEGGARFHHDAFADDDSEGQRGVLFLQLAGRTAWLALGTAALARRVAEFCAGLEADDPSRDLEGLDLEDPLSLRSELALPGCGRLAALVDEDPRFTAFLADCGHAAILAPGDAIVLPNQGLTSTSMHSVFCASSKPTYALSFALRKLEGRGRRRR
ncbi:MAG: hypothetical protein ACYSWX_00070 [Planctomycetota bacterium]